MKYLVMPDAHLKVELLDRISLLLKHNPSWRCISLGDWADDWGRPVEDYKKFFDTLVVFFNRRFPNGIACWGNHDYAYWANPGSCSGFSGDAKDIVRSSLYEIDAMLYDNIRIAHQIDSTIFSHAGIGRYCFKQYKVGLHNYPDKSLLDWLDALDYRRLQDQAFPLWMRPDTDAKKNTFNPKLFQVVGHTPVPTITYDKESNTLYTDTWSTDSERNPLGDKSLVVVDTKTQKWEIIPYE